MLLRPSQHSLFLFFFQLVLLSLRPAVHAVPAGIRRYDTTSVRRQNGDQPLSQPTTVTTVTHTNTPMGPATEICKITLTPIMPDGQPEVQEVKDCTFTLDNGSGDNGSGNGSSDGSSTGSSTASTFSSVATTSTFTSSTSSSDSSSTTAISSATTTASASPSANPAVIVNGVSSGPAVTPSPTSSSPSSSTSATSSASGSSLSSSSTTAAISAADSASSAASAASAAAANASSQAAFTLPGKKLSVLPIGLGVFAGISVIALIVVGLVTYERTKYRKAFRQRKLAEAGQGMGYGGMAERT